MSSWYFNEGTPSVIAVPKSDHPVSSNISQRLFTSSFAIQTDDDHLRLCSKHRVDMVVRLVLVVTTVALLIGPSAVLFLVEGHGSLKICLILTFTLLFAAALSVCTKAKRHEMLVACST